MTPETLNVLETIPGIDALVAKAKEMQADYVKMSKMPQATGPSPKWQAYVASPRYFIECFAQLLRSLPNDYIR